MAEAAPMPVDPSPQLPEARTVEAATGCSERERFLLELEFVQGLANPHYLNWLAQNKYLSEPAFIAYLEYLKYWKDPPYRNFLVYPQSLLFLELLQSENFRTAVANPSVREMIHRQQLYFWKHFRSNRMKEEMELAKASAGGGAAAAAEAGGPSEAGAAVDMNGGGIQAAENGTV
mmetsp:Transcript_13775/g.38991  ORF Transcript_13775/g.38991 Transcript_13775/m.38991 type:complete len:175 (-) Transcript_13775:121-645(-)